MTDVSAKVPKKLRPLEDAYKAGFIGEEEYQTKKTELLSEIERDKARKIFQRFDSDGNGSIDHKELQELVFTLGEIMSDEQVGEIMKELDSDSDGTISFDEFYGWWKQGDREVKSEQGEKLRILKLKLKSKSYLRNTAEASSKLRKSVKVGKLLSVKDEQDDDKLRLNLELAVGNVEKVTAGVTVTLDNQGAAAKLRSEAGIESDVDFFRLSIKLKSDAVDGEIDEGIALLEKTVSALLEEGSSEVPFENLKCTREDKDGAKFLHIQVNFNGEFSGTVKEMLQLVGLELLSFNVSFDTTNQSFSTFFRACCSRTVVELLESLAEDDDDRDIVKFLDVYSNMDVKLKLRTKNLSDDNDKFAKLIEYLDEAKISELGNLLLAEESTQGFYFMSQRLLETFTNASLCIGDLLFSVDIDIPNLSDKFKTEIPESLQKFIYETPLDPAVYPETMLLNSEEHKLKSIGFLGYTCNECSEFGFGWAYATEEDSTIHPDCALLLKPFRLAELNGVVVKAGGEKADVDLTTFDVVGLYFFGVDTELNSKLVEDYKILKAAGKSIEVVYISEGGDEASFKDHFETMPWLALPHDHSLTRRLKKTYSQYSCALFFINAAGKDEFTNSSIEPNLYSRYGHDAFPFTDEAFAQAKDRETAHFNSLPQVGTDKRHKHELVLTENVYYGAYRCDGCSQRGLGWAYHCSECNYDLHEHCLGNTAEWEAEQKKAKQEAVLSSFKNLRTLAANLGLTKEDLDAIYASSSETN